MKSGRVVRLGFAVLVMGLVVALGIMGVVAADQAPTGAASSTVDGESLGRAIVMARLDEIAAIGETMREHTWPSFDALSYPAIFYQPGGWVFAIGFETSPPGFTPIEGVKHKERPLYRAPSGSFAHEGRSPAQVGGRWTIISTFPPPEPAPSGARMGRVPGEEDLGRFFGGAFAIFLMEQRRTATPFSTGAADYPESAELMALTTLEQRAVTTPLQMGNLSEKNMDEFHRHVRTVVAIKRARWKLMGEELATIEKTVELTEGLSVFTATMVHRHAMNKTLVSTGPGKIDGSFVSWVNGPAMRMLGLGYPMFFDADNPAVTLPQVAVRGAVLGALIDKVDAPWRPAALEGKTALIDLLAQAEKAAPEEEPTLLEEARQAYNYDALLNLARADLERLRNDRGVAMGPFMLAGEGVHLEILLSGGEVTSYADDPWRTEHLGEGRLNHPGGLMLKTAGLEVEARPSGPGGGVRIMTRAGISRKQVKLVHIVLPPDTRLMVGGKPWKPGGKPRPLAQTTPLTVDTASLRIRVTAGGVVRRADGVIEATLTH